MKALILYLFMSLMLHPVHMSFTNVEVEQEGEIIIMSRIFLNDLCMASGVDSVNGSYKKAIRTDSSFNKLIDYYKNVFEVNINNKSIADSNIQFRRYKESDQAIRLFFSVNNDFGNIEKITVKNQILTDLYPDQSNLMIINLYDEEESFRLTNEKYEVTLPVE